MSIYQDGILVSVNVCYWSGAKKLINEDMGLSKDKVVDVFKLGRKMLIPEKPLGIFVNDLKLVRDRFATTKEKETLSKIIRRIEKSDSKEKIKGRTNKN